MSVGLQGCGDSQALGPHVRMQSAGVWALKMALCCNCLGLRDGAGSSVSSLSVLTIVQTTGKSLCQSQRLQGLGDSPTARSTEVCSENVNHEDLFLPSPCTGEPLWASSPSQLDCPHHLPLLRCLKYFLPLLC